MGDFFVHFVVERLRRRHEQNVLAVFASPIGGVPALAAARAAEEKDQVFSQYPSRNPSPNSGRDLKTAPSSITV
jgi:hypothetical protein